MYENFKVGDKVGIRSRFCRAIVILGFTVTKINKTRIVIEKPDDIRTYLIKSGKEQIGTKTLSINSSTLILPDLEARKLKTILDTETEINDRWTELRFAVNNRDLERTEILLEGLKHRLKLK